MQKYSYMYLAIKNMGLALISFLFVTACDNSKTTLYHPQYGKTVIKEQSTHYIFGIHPLHNPQRLHKVFGPVAALLSEKIEGADFEIEASRNYAAFDEKLYAGKFAFALPNPYQTVLSLKHGYHVFGKMGDDENFRGIILVRKDSNINEVADLKGKSVSFPAPTALAATMMPQYFLYENGLTVTTDIHINYVGSQESSIMNVFLGNVVAGATWPPPWRALSKARPQLQKELEVKWATESLPNNGLVARDDVPPEIVAQVAQILFDLHKSEFGRDILERMELSKFEAATDTTFVPVHGFLEKFDLNVRSIER